MGTNEWTLTTINEWISTTKNEWTLIRKWTLTTANEWISTTINEWISTTNEDFQLILWVSTTNTTNEDFRLILWVSTTNEWISTRKWTLRSVSNKFLVKMLAELKYFLILLN